MRLGKRRQRLALGDQAVASPTPEPVEEEVEETEPETEEDGGGEESE